MLTTILLFAIGFWLEAPMWYFLLVGVKLLICMIDWGMKLYKAGSEDKQC